MKKFIAMTSAALAAFALAGCAPAESTGDVPPPPPSDEAPPAQ